MRIWGVTEPPVIIPDANVLCLGARVIGSGLALELADIFLETGFEGGRHQRRLDMITQLEAAHTKGE